MMRILLLSLLLMLVATPAHASPELPVQAEKAATYAVSHYDAGQVELLAKLVAFKTVHREGVANADNPEFRAFADFIAGRAEAFGLDFTDLGAVLVVGLGDAEPRLGIVTHGDVQPANPAKWQTSPFELDTKSEPGRLIARGAIDDKGAIATALYAMKTIKELGVPLNRRIELIISLTEESDWAPFLAVLEKYSPPEMNIAIDSQYPVVVAEKGFGVLRVNFDAIDSDTNDGFIERYDGGAFISQVPGDASLTLVGADNAFIERLRERAGADKAMSYRIEQNGDRLTIHAKGKAAHSSTPENGVNALAHIAALLDGQHRLNTAPGRALDFVNALIGLDLYGKHFGDIAYAHSFMGPLTVNLSTARTTPQGVELAINLRAPAGKTPAKLERELRDAIKHWADSRNVPAPSLQIELTEAYLPEQPAQVEPLLAVFRHYTGMNDIGPVSIGGATNARLLPNAVNFGPAMPGAPYTGHSEHEFITREQMTLNLRMYTAVMTWLATQQGENQ